MAKTRLIFAVAAAVTFLGAAASPVKTAVFTGNGPRGRGCVSWLRLVESSPDLDLLLVDADMVRAGALDGADLLIMPGGASVVEKRDLGPEGAAKIRDFVRNGGGYIGTCAGCCLALEEKGDADRGIGLVPYNRIGSKGGYMMPIALNEKGAAALGMAAGEYVVSYHAGPVLVPSTNSVPDANVEVWATYASDFDCPKSSLKMFGNIALVGGTYGKGRLFAIACHPEANVFSLGLVKGAFRFVLGREVSFPQRIHRQGSLVVGAFSSGMSGVETARALLTMDAMENVDFFPMTSDEILTSQLDRVDVLVLPAGNAGFYKSKLSGQTRELVKKFCANGGKVVAWGNAAAFAPRGARIFASAGECVDFIRRASSCPSRACAPIGVFDSGVGGLTVLEQLLKVDRVDNATWKAGPDGIPDLQGESFVQLADQANLHYGSYAASGADGCAFLRELTIRDALFLLSGGYYADASEAVPSGRKTPAKMIVVACNTASAYGLAGVETVLSASASPVKVVGVVNAGARSALDVCGDGAIGVVSTPGTDASKVYPKTIAREAERRGVPAPHVETLGCPDLADAIQRGRADASAVARGFFRSLVGKFRASGAKKPMSVLVFGCTHYPLMRKAFEEALAEMRADPSFAQFLSKDFSFVDPAIETAAECRAILAQEGLLANRSGESKVDMFVSVPCSGLPAEALDASGGLADGYKYGRKAGLDFTDTKFVPISAAPAERDAVFGAAKALPAVRRALCGD